MNFKILGRGRCRYCKILMDRTNKALDIRTSITKTRILNRVFGTLVVGVFVGVTGLAMFTGHWQNSISKEEYQKRFKEIDSPLYQHNRGEVPQYNEQD